MSLLHPATIRLPARGSLLTGTGARSAQVHLIPAPCSLSPCGMCVGPPLELGSVGSLSSLLVHNLNPSPSSTALSFVQNFASPACSDEAFRRCNSDLVILLCAMCLFRLAHVARLTWYGPEALPGVALCSLGEPPSASTRTEYINFDLDV